MSEHQATFQLAVARTALELFAVHGFDATSVDQIAAAAGISRSTFFRQFGSKEDVVFADHAVLLAEARELLARPHRDPWLAVCQAAELVFSHFAAEGELAGRRYAVVNAHPALRDKELVTVFRYEKLFDAHLRAALPELDPLDSVRFAATVIATHNYLLREFMRGARPVSRAQMRDALDAVRRLFGVLDGPAGPRSGVAAARGRDATGASRTGTGSTGADRLDANSTGAGWLDADSTGASGTGTGGTGADRLDANSTGAGQTDAGTRGPGHAPGGTGAPRAADDVVVAVFPRATPAAEILAAVQRALKDTI